MALETRLKNPLTQMALETRLKNLLSQMAPETRLKDPLTQMVLEPRLKWFIIYMRRITLALVLTARSISPL